MFIATCCFPVLRVKPLLPPVEFVLPAGSVELLASASSAPVRPGTRSGRRRSGWLDQPDSLKNPGASVRFFTDSHRLILEYCLPDDSRCGRLPLAGVEKSPFQYTGGEAANGTVSAGVFRSAAEREGGSGPAETAGIRAIPDSRCAVSQQKWQGCGNLICRLSERIDG